MSKRLCIIGFILVAIIFSFFGCTAKENEAINQSMTIAKDTEINLSHRIQATKDISEKIEVSELKSSNADVIIITDEETIKSVNIGKSEISLNANGVKYKFDAKVVEPVHDLLIADEIEILELESKNINVLINSFGVLCSPETLNVKIKYQSSDPEIVDINEEGTMTAKKLGTTNITVQVDGFSAITKECKVIVTK